MVIRYMYNRANSIASACAQSWKEGCVYQMQNQHSSIVAIHNNRTNRMVASAGDESVKFLTYRASIARGLVEHRVMMIMPATTIKCPNGGGGGQRERERERERECKSQYARSN